MLSAPPAALELVPLKDNEPGQLIQFDGGSYGIVIRSPDPLRVLVLGQGKAHVWVAWDDHDRRKPVVRVDGARLRIEIRGGFHAISSPTLRERDSYNGMAAIGPGTRAGVIARQPTSQRVAIGTSVFVDLATFVVSDFDVGTFRYAPRWAIYARLESSAPNAPETLLHEESE